MLILFLLVRKIYSPASLYFVVFQYWILPILFGFYSNANINRNSIWFWILFGLIRLVMVMPPPPSAPALSHRWWWWSSSSSFFFFLSFEDSPYPSINDYSLFTECFLLFSFSRVVFFLSTFGQRKKNKQKKQSKKKKNQQESFKKLCFFCFRNSLFK